MLNEISMEIIRKCPNNCLHCSSFSSMKCTEIITFEKFVEVIDGSFKLGVKTICFSGGEPFLHPQIIDMINYVYNKKLSSYVYTSGIYLDNRGNVSPIPKETLSKISGKVTKLIFNIEASDSETYDKIMGTIGNFELLKESVITATTLNITTEAHFVPMKLNIEQIEDTISLCKQLGISKISFLRLVLHGRALENSSKIALSNEDTKRLKEKLGIIKQSSSIDIRTGVPLSDEESKSYCEAANGKINIRYDGYVYPCEVFKNNRVPLQVELVAETINNNSIESIYKDSVYLNKVRDYVKDFSGTKTCENCVGQYFIQSFMKGEG